MKSGLATDKENVGLLNIRFFCVAQYNAAVRVGTLNGALFQMLQSSKRSLRDRTVGFSPCTCFVLRKEIFVHIGSDSSIRHM